MRILSSFTSTASVAKRCKSSPWPWDDFHLLKQEEALPPFGPKTLLQAASAFRAITGIGVGGSHPRVPLVFFDACPEGVLLLLRHSGRNVAELCEHHTFRPYCKEKFDE